jgi:2-oxoglutarate ferredoxin oxidoreductase subunit alpha
VPEPIIQRRAGATVGVITVGSCDLAVREALDELDERGVTCDFMRVRGFPFIDEVRSFAMAHDRCFVVEQNRDGQLRSLIALEAGVPIEAMSSVLAYGGFPLSAKQVVDSVLTQLEIS